MSAHSRRDLPKASDDIAKSIRFSLFVEGIDSTVSKVDGTYTLTLGYYDAFHFAEYLMAQRDAKDARIREAQLGGDTAKES